MSTQFNRAYSLVFSTPSGEAVEITGLRVVFEITKSIVGYPNLAKIQVYNLSDDTAAKISTIQVQTGGGITTQVYTTVILKAGYAGNIGQVFQGDIFNALFRRDREHKIIEIHAKDGLRDLDEAKFSKSYASGVKIKQIVTDLAKTFRNTSVGKIDGLDDISATDKLLGKSVVGATKGILDKITQEAGVNWSIQDGAFYTIGVDSADESVTAKVISRRTGMIGSPALTEIGADVTTQLDPDFLPNRLIKVDSEAPEVNLGNLAFRKVNRTLGNGIFKINKVTHRGDNRGPVWQSEIVGRRFA